MERHLISNFIKVWLTIYDIGCKKAFIYRLIWSRFLNRSVWLKFRRRINIMHTPPISDFIKIWITIYDICEEVKLWLHIKQALLRISEVESRNCPTKFNRILTYRIKWKSSSVLTLILGHRQMVRHDFDINVLYLFRKEYIMSINYSCIHKSFKNVVVLS
jgi:hypothetical protein